MSKEKATNRLALGILLSLGLGIGVVFLAVLSGSWRLPDIFNARSSSGNEDQTKKETSPSFRRTNTASPFSVTLYREGRFVHLDPFSNTEFPANYFIPAVPVLKSVVVNRFSGAAAYVSQENSADVVYLKRASDREPIQLLQARHSFSADEEAENQFVNQRLYFSPRGQYLVVQKALWEGCESYLYDVATAKVVLQSACDQFVWTEDDSRVARIVISYGDPSHLSFGYANDPTKFVDVDWSKVNGAPDVLKNYVTLGAQDFIAASFRTPDELILISGADDQGELSVVSYSFSANSARLIAKFQSPAYERAAVVGNDLLIVDERQTLVVDLAGGSTITYKNLIQESSFNGYTFIAKTDSSAFLLERTFDGSNQVINERLIVMNIRDLTFSEFRPYEVSESLIADVNTE